MSHGEVRRIADRTDWSRPIMRNDIDVKLDVILNEIQHMNDNFLNHFYDSVSRATRSNKTQELLALVQAELRQTKQNQTQFWTDMDEEYTREDTKQDEIAHGQGGKFIAHKKNSRGRGKARSASPPPDRARSADPRRERGSARLREKRAQRGMNSSAQIVYYNKYIA